MYSDKSTALLTQQFWTSFGQYMAPIPSADGEKINWINYKTDVRFVRFRLQTDKLVSVAIELLHPDIRKQLEQFEKLVHLKKQFQEICGTDWKWQKTKENGEAKITSTIQVSIGNVSIMDLSQWPQVISFFKPRLISLDNFWCNYKFALQ